MGKIGNFLYAKYRAFTWLSCFDSPRTARLSGWKRWKWLARQRRTGRLIEPTAEFWCDDSLDSRLILGRETYLDRGVIVWIGNEVSLTSSLELGERVYIGPYAFLGSCHRLEIGDDTMIGAHSYVITANHITQRQDIPYVRQGYAGADVKIGRNVWIGCHVTILPGVTIGDHAIIGAGAVVTKNVPAGETWAGVPAKKISSSGSKTAA